MTESKFTPQQAIEIRDALRNKGVDYLFLGKSGAILLGYPATTQDVDIFTPKDRDNAQKLIVALQTIGFQLDPEVQNALLDGKDFIQIKTGPFDLDIIHAPDGIESFQAAKTRAITTPEGFPVTSLEDILNSKKEAGRTKDLLDIPLLESFRDEYRKRNPKKLKSSKEIINKDFEIN